MSLPFTIIIPGLPPLMNFDCTNNIYHCDVQNPGKITNICMTLIQPLANNGYILALYFTAPPYQNLQFLGAINNQKPSEIISTGFPMNENLSRIDSIKICVRLQTPQEIGELIQQFYAGKDDKKQYTKLVAQNLYNYMMSYNKTGLLVNGDDGQYLVIPANFLDRWLQKFQAKYRMDPNFIYKTSTK